MEPIALTLGQKFEIEKFSREIDNSDDLAALKSGVFYCPYVPLTMVRAVAEDSFQPKIGFKTRYGMVSNPFVGSTPSDGLAAVKTNQYYRIFRVDNILGA